MIFNKTYFIKNALKKQLMINKTKVGTKPSQCDPYKFGLHTCYNENYKKLQKI